MDTNSPKGNVPQIIKIIPNTTVTGTLSFDGKIFINSFLTNQYIGAVVE